MKLSIYSKADWKENISNHGQSSSVFAEIHHYFFEQGRFLPLQWLVVARLTFFECHISMPRRKAFAGKDAAQVQNLSAFNLTLPLKSRVSSSSGLISQMLLLCRQSVQTLKTKTLETRVYKEDSSCPSFPWLPSDFDATTGSMRTLFVWDFEM